MNDLGNVGWCQKFINSDIIYFYNIKLYNIYYQNFKNKIYHNYKNENFKDLKYKFAYRKED
jgi:hypothetical protein